MRESRNKSYQHKGAEAMMEIYKQLTLTHNLEINYVLMIKFKIKREKMKTKKMFYQKITHLRI